MHGKTRLWFVGVAGCLILTAAWTSLSTPSAALAKGKPPGSGGGNGQFNTQGYWVWFSQDALGVFEPEGPPPDGSAEDAINDGAIDVVAGAVGDPNDPRMIVNFNQSCLPSYPGGPKTIPWALLSDDDFDSPDVEVFLDCFPAPSQGAMIVSADGTTVQMNIHGLSKSGQDMGYKLTIRVDSIKIDGVAADVWDPLAIDLGASATLSLGAWTLTTSNPNQQRKGCSASGDFSDDVDPNTGAVTAITVSRWTKEEQDAHDLCE
jgi:hypothetical protein